MHPSIDYILDNVSETWVVIRSGEGQRTVSVVESDLRPSPSGDVYYRYVAISGVGNWYGRLSDISIQR